VISTPETSASANAPEGTGGYHVVDGQLSAQAPEPLPPCKNPSFAFELDGLTQSQVLARFGAPALQESFRVQDRQGEFYVGIANTYPTTDPKNREVPLEEWTWTSGECILTVWFHRPNGIWLALDDVYWHKDTAF
jgi:hypothetical protein